MRRSEVHIGSKWEEWREIQIQRVEGFFFILHHFVAHVKCVIIFNIVYVAQVNVLRDKTHKFFFKKLFCHTYLVRDIFCVTSCHFSCSVSFHLTLFLAPQSLLFYHLPLLFIFTLSLSISHFPFYNQTDE